MDKKKATELVPVTATQLELPPILVGRVTPAVEAQVRSFYGSVAEIFERWVTWRSSTHTQRAYHQDVMDFVQSLVLRWPEESTRLFTVSIAEVQAFRDQMVAESKAPKTINRQIASLSSFYKRGQGGLAFQGPDVPAGGGGRTPGVVRGDPGADRSTGSGAEPGMSVRYGRVGVTWNRGGRGWCTVR